jgi:hypothetical protein
MSYDRECGVLGWAGAERVKFSVYYFSEMTIFLSTRTTAEEVSGQLPFRVKFSAHYFSYRGKKIGVAFSNPDQPK